MDAIRKKMQSLKGETDGLYATIAKFEESSRDYQKVADQVNNLSRIFAIILIFFFYFHYMNFLI